MTVYSRSDLAAIAISPAHGGCGTVHSRPAPGGSPVPVWQLTCVRCEDHLRADPLWSSTEGSIPETPDEAQTRTNAEARTQREQLSNNVSALTTIGQALVEIAQSNKNQGDNIAQALAAALGPLLAGAAPQAAPSAAQGADLALDPAATPPAPPGDARAQLAPLQEALEKYAADRPEAVTVLPPGNGGATLNQLRELQDALNAVAGDPAWKHHYALVNGDLTNADDVLERLGTMGMPALNALARALGLPGRRSIADQADAIRRHLGR